MAYYPEINTYHRLLDAYDRQHEEDFDDPPARKVLGIILKELRREYGDALSRDHLERVLDAMRLEHLDRRLRQVELRTDNDIFRKGLIDGLERFFYFLTPRAAEKPHWEAILEAVRDFDDFTDEDDPSGEHRRGRVRVEGEDFVFEVSYRDQKLVKPALPFEEEFFRVLTIMCADEAR